MNNKEFELSTHPFLDGVKTIWKNDEDNKIPIINGKATFYDKNTGAHFELFVKQVKGMGVAAADKIEIVSEKHKALIESMMPLDGEHSSEAIMARVFQHVGAHYFKEQHYRGTLSELVRKRVIMINMTTNPPVYQLVKRAARRCLESGKFEPFTSNSS